MKVLVADVSRTAALLAGQDVTLARTMGEVRAALAAARYDVLVIGVRFDDSRMFDLLREVRGDARYRDLRVLCVIPSATLAPACRALQAETLLEADVTSVAGLISVGRP
jgi:DNA-binding NtrC family response regulator